MKLIDLGTELAFDLDKVEVLRLHRTEITPELSLGDIYDLTLVLNFANMVIVIKDLEKMGHILKMLEQPQFDSLAPGKDSKLYFVNKAFQYQDTCKRNEEAQ